MFAAPLNPYGKDDLSFSDALRATRTNTRNDRVDIVESGIRIHDGKTYEVVMTVGFDYIDGNPSFSYKTLHENVDYSRRPYVNRWIQAAKTKFEMGMV